MTRYVRSLGGPQTVVVTMLIRTRCSSVISFKEYSPSKDMSQAHVVHPEVSMLALKKVSRSSS